MLHIHNFVGIHNSIENDKIIILIIMLWLIQIFGVAKLATWKTK